MIIPPEFWQTITEEDGNEIMEAGGLNRRLCRRLWWITGRTGKPPHFMELQFSREDVMREFPEIKKN